MTSSSSSIDPLDWTTLCQSELAAMAVDREFAEGLALATELWNAMASARVPLRDPSGPTRPDATPGATAGGVAPGDGGDDAELTRLRRRVAELERKSTS